MKYLKLAVCVFVFSIVLSKLNVNAAIGIQNLTLPIFSGANTTQHATKTKSTLQKVSKVKCVDSLTGEERAVVVATKQTSQNISSSAITISSQNILYSIPNSDTVGATTLYIQNAKSTVTTAKFSGLWVYD